MHEKFIVIFTIMEFYMIVFESIIKSFERIQSPKQMYIIYSSAVNFKLRSQFKENLKHRQKELHLLLDLDL